MKIYTEQSLANFKFWSGAETTAQRIWEEQGSEGFDQLEAILEDLYPDGIDETDLNDLLWFDADTVYEWLGIEDEEDEEKVIQLIQEQIDDIAYIKDSVYTDGEGLTYNSIVWKNMEK